MITEDVRAALRAAIAERSEDALLLTVRRIAAAELRAAADAYDEGDGASLACAFFRMRADALDGASP